MRSYKYEEKSTSFFSTFEKNRGVQNRIRKLIVEEKEKTDHKETLNNINKFYEKLFQLNSNELFTLER